MRVQRNLDDALGGEKLVLERKTSIILQFC